MCRFINICILIIYYLKVCGSLGDAWYSFHHSVVNTNREELVITNVTADRVIRLQSNVSEWKSLTVGPTCYSVGISNIGIEILMSVLNKTRTGFVIKNYFVPTEHKPNKVVIFSNRKNGKSEVIVVVSFFEQNHLVWMSISDEHVKQNFWSWSLEDTVQHINFFKIETRNILFISNVNNEGYLYEFDINEEHPKKWFLQNFFFKDVATSSAFNNFQGNYFLSILQKNVILIYKYENNQFVLRYSLKSPEVTCITSFNIGFKTFFAINGLNAGIYEFKKNGVERQKIENGNLDGVDFWLSVPIETYRDEVFLISQRTMDHTTHNASEVDIFTYNGKFEEHEDIACSLFEEHSSRLTCLTQDTGIFGSSYIVIDSLVGLIVPKPMKICLVFTINTCIREISNPKEKELGELLEMKKHLEVLIEKENDMYEKITKVSLPNINRNINKSLAKTAEVIVGETQNLSSYLSEVDKIGMEVLNLAQKVENITKNEMNTNFNSIIINGNVIFEDSVVVEDVKVETIHQDDATKLINDIVRKNNITNLLKNKTFGDLTEVENSNSKIINNIDTQDIVFKDSSEIVINGNIIFEKFVVLDNIHLISGNINDVHFSTEALITGKQHEGVLKFDEINVAENLRAARINDIYLQRSTDVRSNTGDNITEVSDVHIPKNATITFINGENFTDFIHSLCLTNVKCVIPGDVRITQNVTAKQVTTEYLNDLKFPEEYVLIDSNSSLSISGQKRFNKTVTAGIVTAKDTINGIRPNDIVTLNTEQNLMNKTFVHFGINNEIKFDGKIVGDLADAFLPNPTLEDVNEIKSNVVFKNLEVKGNVYIENNFNNQNYQEFLKSFIYQDEENVTVSSVKTFSKGFAASELDISSGTINNVNLSTILTENTDQILQLNLLNGTAKIKRLFVNGTFDGININEIEKNLVKVTNEEFINGTLTFHDLEVAKLEVLRKINDLEENDYVFITGDGEIDANITFDDLIIETMGVKGKINGNISAPKLQDFNKNYLSLTKNQTITKHFNIKGSTVNHLTALNINGNTTIPVLNENDFVKKLKQKLNAGNITIENLYIMESMEVKKVNNKPVDSILPINLKYLINNSSNKELIFENDIFVPAVEIEELSSINWNNYVKQLVFTNESDVFFSGTKTFQNGITVDKLVEIKQLNDVPLPFILTKEKNQVINGPVEVEGDITFKKIQINGTMNGESVQEVLNLVFVSNRSYHVNSDIIFRRLPYIVSFKVNGRINNKDIESVFKDTAYLNKDITLTNRTIFKEPIFIGGNLAVRNLFNNIQIADTIPNIVLTTSDASIDSVISFTNNVMIQEHTMIEENLSSHVIAGLNISDIVDNSIPLDKGLLKGHYTFEQVLINDNLITDFVNDTDMKTLVPLGTNQKINRLAFKELNFVNDIAVGKTVNGLQLLREVERTLMKESNQEISTITLLKNIMIVRHNLTTIRLNNEPTSRMVTTDRDQILTANYNFNSQSEMQSNLNITGSINGINFDEWKNKTLKINSDDTQFICNNWKVENLTFVEDVEGFNKISDLDLNAVSKEIGRRKSFKLQLEHEILDDYKGICKDVTFFYKKAQSQIYKFKYFEDFQHILFPSTINNVFYFVFKTKHFLLINQRNCLSHIYIFNGIKFVTLFGNISTGQIEQIVLIRNTKEDEDDDDNIVLVSRGNKLSKCDNHRGVNIWIFNENGLNLKYNMEEQDLLQESVIPSTFYSIGKEGVIEYKIKNNIDAPVKYRKWDIFNENAAFVPRGLGTGLAIRTGRKLIFLDQTEPIVEDIDTNLITEIIIKGSTTSEDNQYMPGRNGGDLTVINVGVKSAKTNFLAVATHEETVVKGYSDFIKIYENPLKGKLFDKVSTYKPSSLLSVEFNQGETLLVFLENGRTLRVFEYRGIEGFIHRSSVKMEATHLFKMDLPVQNQLNSRKAIGVVNKNEIRILISEMDGNQIRDNLNCKL